MAKKKNMRNEFEFMSAVLDALGVQYKEADIKVRERWRSKVLDGWGVSYIPDDLKQFERWRKKCIEGLSKNSGGSGENPNHLQTVSGTLASPWGEINFEELYTALANKNATATMTIDATALGIQYVIAKLSASNVSENLIYSNGAMFAGDEPNFTVSAFTLSWWHSDGELYMAYMYKNNTINSIKSYANSLPTSLEIIWHPLEATTGA